MNSPAPAPPTTPQTSTLAVISLVFGIVCWFVLPFIGALVAIICGHMGRSEIRRAAPGTMEGSGMALAGLILGWAQMVLIALAIMFVFLFLGGLAFLASMH
ncbi:MAG: DUF4190 domain-containing protein [Dokdonella sp.]|uniref:DUF4190 domain-containing protein n=1 Tax=Dokdonella sp. TaxID=2291710 RepID=UPI0025C2BE79|nr:DUF4190 domain-containing protein [Dokdonella sp.]MBX3701316.1 DUF4190 domain-containing protein [Dokdonella sp.]